MKKIVLITAAVAVVSLGIAAILFFTSSMKGRWEPKEGITVDERRTFSPEGIAEINVQTSSTDVLVGKSEGSSIEVYLHGTVYTTRAEAIPTLQAEQTVELLQIATERKNKRAWFLGFYSDDLLLEIGVPEQYRNRLVVRTSSGDVKLFLTEAARFRLEARASSGDIRCEFPVTLEGTSGEMSRNTVIGTVADGRHQVVVKTSSGDITIRP